VSGYSTKYPVVLIKLQYSNLSPHFASLIARQYLIALGTQQTTPCPKQWRKQR